MLIDRRGFLASVGAAVTQVPRAVDDERVLRAMVITDRSASVELGFRTGLAEARRMADLLGVDWRKAAGSGAGSRGRVVISTMPLRPSAPPTMYSVRASATAKERALRLARQRDPHAAATIVEWHPALEKFGGAQLNARLAAGGRAPDAGVWAGWMAVKVAAESILRHGGAAVTPAGLLSLTFDGHKGTALRFDARDRHLHQPLYIVSAGGDLQGVVDPEEGES